ncbi:MAG: hypothetical protein ACXAEU_06350 [Candidatus Hodarchaeales archaeon]|jgi:hypothetical protein
MKLMICGSRSIKDKTVILTILQDFFSSIDPMIQIHVRTRGAKGVDEISEALIRQHFPWITILPALKPDHRYGRGAQSIRDRELVDWSNMILSIWNGNSESTWKIINYAEKRNKHLALKYVEVHERPPLIVEINVRPV